MKEYDSVIIEESAEDIKAADQWYNNHKQAMQSEEVQSYLRFMYNPDNYMHCSDCPENQEFSSWPGYRLPCGQFSCWVRLH